ncbi:MAG: lysophospholipase [Cyanobacteria bacterium]|nr:lysophospholipase [Cyanobacteriota bacterium]
MSKRKMIALISTAVSLLTLSLPAEAAKSKTTAKSKKGQPWYSTIKVPHRSWVSSERPREVLLCVHGLGFSSESFNQFGKTMARKGMAVFAVDVRGFGDWLNKRSTSTVDFEACLTDVESALKNLRKAFPGTPVFIVGESMGGAIAMRAASRYPQLVNGLISSVPSNERYADIKTHLVVGVRYLTDKNKPINIAPEVMERASDNPVLQQQWEADKSNRMELSAKELKQFNDFMKGNYDAAALIEKTPVLLLAGFKDKLVKPEGTISLFNALSVDDKLLMVVGDGEHLLLEENQLTDQLATLIANWIQNEARSKTPGIHAHP